MNLAGNLKFLRKKFGKTQDSLSSELNIGRTTIANYESGLSEPNVETLLIFSNYFGISVDNLLSMNLEKELPNTKLIDLSGLKDKKKYCYKRLGAASDNGGQGGQ